MIEILLKILPLIIIFSWGFGLKKLNLFKSDDGSILLKVIFYAGAPALIFNSIMSVEINKELFVLALFPSTVVFITFLSSTIFQKYLLKVNLKTFASLMIGAMIMNTGILIPFIENLYGKEGLARLAIIDVGNGIVTFSFIYAMAVKYGKGNVNTKFIFNKLLISPTTWALIIAVILKILNIQNPELINNTFTTLSRIVSGLVLLALGMKFNPEFKQIKLLLNGLILRFVLGFFIGILFINIFDLEGINATVVFLCSLAPVGFNSITFSELEDLDTKFAASFVSFGLITSLIILTIVVITIEKFRLF